MTPLCVNINYRFLYRILLEYGFSPWASGFTLSGGWFTANPGWLFLAELIAIILVLSGAYRVLDAWIARVSREERALLEARQAAILAAEKEEKGDKSHVSQ